MKTRVKFISCILALVIITAGAAWAQNEPKDPTSPTNDATVGLVATEIDQFVNVLDWGKVKFDKAFVFMDFEQGYKWTVDLGAAFNAGPLFIGSWYQGNLGYFTGRNNKDVKTVIEEGTPSGTLGNVTNTAGHDLYKRYGADHSAVMLFGFDNIGIRTGYLRSGNNYSGNYFKPADDPNALGFTVGAYHDDWKPDNTVTTKSKEPEYLASTVYSPKGYVHTAKHKSFVDFGMNIPLGKMILSPEASLNIMINQGGIDESKAIEPPLVPKKYYVYKYNTYYGLETITNKDSSKKYKITKTQKAASKAHVGITGKLGAGLSLGDSLKSVLGLGYEFTVNAYGKSYKAADGTKHKIRGNYVINTDTVEDDYNKTNAGVHKIIKTFDGEFTKKSYFSNTLRLNYRMQKDFTDRLSLLAGVELPVTVGFEKSVTEKKYKKVEETKNLNPSLAHTDTVVTTTVVSPIETVNTLNLEVNPSIKAAISYAAMPNRVFLNLGTNIKFLGGNFTREKTSWNSFVKTTTTVTEKNNGPATTVTEAAPDEPVNGQTESLNKTSEQYSVYAQLMGGLRWNIVENVAFDLVYTTTLLEKTIEWYKFQNLKLACTIKF